MKNSEAYRRYTILVSAGEMVRSRYHAPSKSSSPLYSMKLHMRVRRARTNCDTSLTILALSLGDSVVNHLARRFSAC